MKKEELGESPVVIVEEGSVGLVETRYYTFADLPDKFVLENGLELGPITVAYETYGTLNKTRDNVILVEHALTASSHAAGKNSPEDKNPGWWDVMIGPGKAFDTDKYFVICSNILGSCYGTTGPSSVNSQTGKPYGSSFPVVSIRDIVRVQYQLLRHLGVERIRSIAGGSMGGMQAVEWALQYPDMVDSLLLIATAARSSPQSIAMHKVGIQAIMNDLNWNGGDYYGNDLPEKGLSIARMLGHITYLSDGWLWEKFGRKHDDSVKIKSSLDSKFEIEKYLEYQGSKFVKRFDANSYIYIMRCLDLYDAGEGYVNLNESFKRIKCKKVLVATYTSDWLYPSYQSSELADAFNANNIDVSYNEIDSPYGHDSFLIDYKKLNPLIDDILNSLT